MAATGTTRTRRNPTQADVIHTMLVQSVNTAQARVTEALRTSGPDKVELVARYKGERDALITMRDRVRRYLDHDLSAIYG